MAQRRTLVISGLVLGLLWPIAAAAQPVPGASEASLRDAFSRFQSALSEHDVVSLREIFTADAVWIFADELTKQSGDEVASYIGTSLLTYEFKLEIARLKIGDGRDPATLVLRGQVLLLPKKDGKYPMVFNRDPMLTRWRLEDDRWKLYYVMGDVGKAAALVKAEGLE